MKKGVRLLGIDDAAFELDDDQANLTGVVYRGTEFIEDIKFEKVDVDGYDATEKVIRLFEKCNNPKQIKAVLLDGISFAGFNIVDIYEVAERTGKTVVTITSNKPDPENFQKIMSQTVNQDQKFGKFDSHTEIELEDGRVYIQFAGADLEEAEDIVDLSVINGPTHEPIRVAHMIGQGLKDV